jgi:hypothetical protein
MYDLAYVTRKLLREATNSQLDMLLNTCDRERYSKKLTNLDRAIEHFALEELSSREDLKP